jgi:hypothetical protein
MKLLCVHQIQYDSAPKLVYINVDRIDLITNSGRNNTLIFIAGHLLEVTESVDYLIEALR